MDVATALGLRELRLLRRVWTGLSFGADYVGRYVSKKQTDRQTDSLMEINV